MEMETEYELLTGLKHELKPNHIRLFITVGISVMLFFGTCFYLMHKHPAKQSEINFMEVENSVKQK